MSIPIIDSFGAVNDSAMPSIVHALDPEEVQRLFKRRLTRLVGERDSIHLKAIKVIRHKPEKRCMIEYDVEVEHDNNQSEIVTLIGKIRAKRFGKAGYRLLNLFRNAGFTGDSKDGISVPEPIGTIPKFRMWLQRKAPGRLATYLLNRPESDELVKHIAETAHKIHKADVPTERCHTMDDEIRILNERLAVVARMNPKWDTRIKRILGKCDVISKTITNPCIAGIHRDFYSDQVIVDNQRLHLIDFDLYCEGDSGLDIGNFIGHMTEQGLRALGDPTAFSDIEKTIEERFVELSGEKTRISVRVYTTLTLVRHIYLSTLFPERQPFTETLIDLCEERLEVTVQ